MLKIDLTGKKAFIAGIGDDQGFGWAIAKAFAEAGAEIIVATWTPLYKIFTTNLNNGKFDESRKLSDGSLMQFAKIYPLDAAYDVPQDIPEEVKENKRYKEASLYTVSEVAECIKNDFGKIDIIIHSLASAPEIQKPLIETSRVGYLAAISSSAYSLISLLKYFGPLCNEGSSALSLTYLAAERAIPGYGGGMSSAKAALESDIKTLAWEAGKKWGMRLNAISAGPLASRAARAIGFIGNMIAYSKANAPLAQELEAEDVANAAAFLSSSLASAITATVVYVDNGLHSMAVSTDSPTLG